MKKSNKLIKGLETIAIIILIISFITLVYCVYISIRAEQSYGSNYQASRTAENIIKEETEDQDISQTIEKINLAVVGISKIKNKGNTIFLKDGVSSLGLGTGFIVSQDGYIVTNEHVSGTKNETCYVTLEDGRNFNAKVIWADNDIDLSIIKINTNSLNFVELGDSDNAKIAQTVYAIGNPIGIEFERTVTKGIISGTNRTIKLEEEDKTSYMEDLIQTDASINEGNSGGPLVNVNGEMIGITTIKIASVEGIGFAVPINTIKPIIQKFLQTGKFEEAFIGIYGFDREVIPYLNGNIEFDSGIYVDEVSVSGPSYKSGLQEGDIITQIDQVTLNKMSEFRNYIYQKQPGDNVTLKVLRNRREIEINITLGKRG